jgi:cell pole-organizing protein PopZ
MEEILASIRRIIESNEPVAPGAFSGQLPAAYDDENEEVADLSAFAAETRSERRIEAVSPPSHVPPPANQPYGAAQQAPEKSMSLADVAARVRAAADRNSALGPQAFSSAPEERYEPSVQPPARVSYENPVLTSRMADLRSVRPGAPAPVAAPAFEAYRGVKNDDAPVLPETDVTWDQSALETLANLPEVTDVFERGLEIALSEPVETPIAEEAGAPLSGLSVNLISAQAGAQIARSFGELADIFDGVERRSIEQMAEEMLRPMLQDWLEDNLPTLVERLVREEIERVARGPRR